MNRDYLDEKLKELYKKENEDNSNPLAKYSISQLKAELRRRKNS